jgi:hypothetical protein
MYLIYFIRINSLSPYTLRLSYGSLAVIDLITLRHEAKLQFLGGADQALEVDGRRGCTDVMGQ